MFRIGMTVGRVSAATALRTGASTAASAAVAGTSATATGTMSALVAGSAARAAARSGGAMAFSTMRSVTGHLRRDDEDEGDASGPIGSVASVAAAATSSMARRNMSTEASGSMSDTALDIDTILGQIREVLVNSPEIAEKMRSEADAQLAVLNRRLDNLQPLHDDIMTRAGKSANRVMITGCTAFIIQISVIGRLTWWEYSWDIMEPVSYIVGVAQIAAGWLFFNVTKADTSYDSMRDYFVQRKANKLLAKSDFPAEEYDSLVATIEALKGTAATFEQRRTAGELVQKQLEDEAAAAAAADEAEAEAATA